MEITTSGNTANIRLGPKEKYFLKDGVLSGFRNFNTLVVPPFMLGSPIARIIHRCYFGMKTVEGTDGGIDVPLAGYYPQGSFYLHTIPAGHRHFVNLRNFAGFCDQIRSISTKIRFSFAYWCLAEHFFTVFEGPGTVLLYSRSGLQSSSSPEYATSRIVCFDATRRFRPTSPTPTSIPSIAYEVSFSNEVIWHFTQPGETVVETYHEGMAAAERLRLKDVLIHLLGLYKF